MNKEMIKIDSFICAGLFLAIIPVSAQPSITEPVRYADDAKQIYLQDFNGNARWETIQLNEDPRCPTTLYTWDINPVDYIDEVEYYKRQDSNDRNTDILESGSSISGMNIYNGSSDWEIAGVRDTFMFLFNGIIRTQSKWPEDSILSYDSHAIIAHTPASQNGIGAGPNGMSGREYGLARYGEDGGKNYFCYTSANGAGVASYSNGVVPEYDRALFARLNPGDIEDYSSYRVTVYVKATQLGRTAPTLGLQLMRGYTNSEKDFPQDLSGNLSFNSTRSFTDFEKDKWQKITLMAYYNNDSIADGYFYKNGYWWPNNWVWRTAANKDDGTVSEYGDTTMIFRYIKQPDKFFVRMSFRSDSTRFDVDNLSVSKSWIAGVEHYNDMLRVDFGYQTDLVQLAQQAKNKYNIASVEVPGVYFDVWARWGTEWEKIPILTAEYQGDGYMYLWTRPFDDGSSCTFDGADEVLVSFRNPVDNPDLTLHYTGNLYPNGIDKDWIAGGRRVFDFHNEISSFNPTIAVSPVTGKIVKSLKDLAPVLQNEPFEDGTFGIDPYLRSMTLKFSKTVAYDNKGEGSILTQVLLKQGGNVEYWDIASSDENGYTEITRPAKYSSALAGDYVLEIKHITHVKYPDVNYEDYGDDVTLNYHFGAFDVNPVAHVVSCSDWRNEDYNVELLSGQRYYPESVYIHSNQDPFTKGTGGMSYGKCGLYLIGDDDCQIYFSNRSGNTTGNIYVVESLTAGNYTISFNAILWGGSRQVGRTGKLYVYAKPSGELENGNDNGFAILEAATKTLIGTYTPKVYATSASWPDGTETFEYSFSIPVTGDYMFEWVDDEANNNNGYYGFAIGNYTIKTAGGLSFMPVLKLNEAIERATSYLSGVAPEYRAYYALSYNVLSEYKDEACAYIAKTVDDKVAYPSKYDSVITAIDNAIAILDYLIESGGPITPLVNTIYMDSVSCEQGDRLTIPVKMMNSNGITAFSFDVKLPEGVTFVEAELAGGRNNNSHQLYSQCNGQTLTLVCFSSANEMITGNDGTILNIIVDVTDAPEGEYQISFENIEMTSSATSYFRPDDTYGKMTVLKYVLPGDVNQDGVISISDAVGVIAFIINSNTDKLERRAADANQDGTIDVADAVFVVNKVIHKSLRSQFRNVSAPEEISSALSVDNADGGNVLSVYLDGKPDEITALQFDLSLPVGTKLENLTTDEKHLVVSGLQEDGCYRVVCLSMENSTFTGNGMAALTLQLTSDEMTDGASVVMNDAKIVAPDGRTKSFKSIICQFGNREDFKPVDIEAEGALDKVYDLKGRPAKDKSNGVFISNGKKLLQIK